MTSSDATDLTIRRATADDVAPIVALLADDPQGAARETPNDLEPYHRVFDELDRDPQHLLVVVEQAGEIVGTAQLTYIPGLSRRGATRAQIEGVRIAGSVRGSGLGAQLIEWCIKQARKRDCHLVQLTSDASRQDAHRFYTRLGFRPTHTGFKMDL